MVRRRVIGWVIRGVLAIYRMCWRWWEIVALGKVARICAIGRGAVAASRVGCIFLA